MTQKMRLIIGVSVSMLLIAGAAFAVNLLRSSGIAGTKQDEQPGSISGGPDSSASLGEGAQPEPSGVTEGEPEYRKISAEEAYRMMNETGSVLILDVRTEEEYREQHIQDAVLIPDYELSQRAEIELPDKTVMILVYCRSGRRSENAAYELVGMGYTNVYDFGGIIDWTYDVE